MQRFNRGERRRDWPPAENIDRAGIEKADHALELVEIPGHQRIGRRDRSSWYADMHGPEREQRVIDAVVGENDQRVLGAQALREDPGGYRANPPQRISVGEARPRRVAIRNLAPKNPLTPLPRPLLQPRADASRPR